MNGHDGLISGINLSTVRAFLPRIARKKLNNCPDAGGGVHPWLYGAACTLGRAGVYPEMAARLIREGSRDCGRYVEAREITDAIANAGRSVGSSARVTLPSEPRPKPWPAPNLEQIEAIAMNGIGLAGLQALSPVKFHNEERHTEEIIDRLFPDNPLICCGRDKNKFTTRPREEWREKLAPLPFIVPSPMTALTGITKSDKVSPRALTNTGARRFQIIEFDYAEHDKEGRDNHQAPMLRALAEKGITVLDLCASLLLHLAQYAALSLVVFSGGKSLHGWFHCEGQVEENVHRFMRYAVSLGGDPATWTRNQMVRMPDGSRSDGNGARQTVHYFNPEVANVR